jgi:hypothetical protein
MINRKQIITTSLLGLTGAVILTALSLLVVTTNLVTPLLTHWLIVYILFGLFFLISLAEIPLMIFAMYQMASSSNPAASKALLITNSSYVLFGAIYGVAFILLTGEFLPGLGLAALTLIRFVTAIVFLKRL